MKYEMILELQKKLYEKLSSNVSLMQLVSGVFNYVPKDTKFPYIHFGKIISNDWSTKNSQGLQLLFNITIFSKAQGNREILEILFLLTNLLDHWEVKCENKYLVNLKLLTSDIEQQNATFQAILRFKANIEEIQ